MSVSGYILPILALSLQILGDSEENREVYAAVGTTIDIYCGTSKSDAQNGEWSYQKRESEPEKRVPEDVIESPMKLEFKIVRQNHSGIYSCTSSNTTIVKITLFVGELPRVPENVHVEPSVDEHEYSFLKIIWDDFDNDYDTEYVLEILNREETRKWTRVARTRNCCIMRYEHVSPARTAQVRLAAVNKYGSSNYSESEPFLLPNRVQPPFLQFRIVHEADFKLYLEWERICEEPIIKYYLVRYRTIEHKVQWKEFDVSRNSTYTEILISHETEYIIQLKGIGEHRNYTGSQLFYKTKPRSGHAGALNFTWTPQALLEVYFDLPAEFAGKEISYNIAIHEGSPDEKAKNKMFTSLERRVLIKEKMNHFERYYIRLEYKTTGNDSLSGSTDLFYVRTAEGIPGQVRNLKLNGSKTNLHTKEYAVFPITWDEPSVKKGQIIGYKIRWKLSKLHFDIFVVEQCGKSYEIKVFSHNERYKAFVSAKTIVGYGAETELAFGASVAVATLDAGTMTAVVLSFFCTAIFSS